MSHSPEEIVELELVGPDSNEQFSSDDIDLQVVAKSATIRQKMVVFFFGFLGCAFFVVFLLLILAVTLPRAPGKANREFFIRAELRDWNYLGLDAASDPSVLPATNRLTGHPFTQEELIYIEQTNATLGASYLKCIYIGYSKNWEDALPRPAQLGLLGPTLRCNPGDTLRITFANDCPFPTSLHPHGLEYTKNNEGALYLDPGSKAESTAVVDPGSQAVYEWTVRTGAAAREAPELSNESDQVQVWMYHSHTNEETDTNAGLMGAIVVSNSLSVDTDPEENIFIWSILDENESPLLAMNIERTLGADFAGRSDPLFVQSNLMHSINGYIFGTLPNFSAPAESVARVHMAAMGNEADIHAIHFHNQAVQFHQSRQLGDAIGLLPASMAQVFFKASSQPGNYMVHCTSENHLRAGMGMFLEVASSAESTSPPPLESGRVVEFFLSAESVLWDYLPLEVDPVSQINLTANPNIWTEQSGTRIGTRYLKAKFNQYTDIDFSQQVSPPNTFSGILGPTMRVAVGDRLRVTLRNTMGFPISLQIHGTDIVSQNVQFGQTRTFETVIRADALGPDDGEAVLFPYHSEVLGGVSNIHSGLAGAMIVYKEQVPSAEQIANEYVIFASEFDENLSPFFAQNIAGLNLSQAEISDPAFVESNKMYHYNGFAFGNLPFITTTVGTTLRFFVFTFGDEDLHSFTFHGIPVLSQNHTHMQAVTLLPGMSAVFDLQPDEPGSWLFHCPVVEHRVGGMAGLIMVQGSSSSSPSTIVREHFLMITEIDWDYTPTYPFNILAHRNYEGEELTWVEPGPSRIGHIFRKAHFLEFFDSSFSSTSSAGLIGPTLRVHAGETLRVTVRNNASFPFSFHVDGLSVPKSQEGSNYAGGTWPGGALAPGEQFEYTYVIPSTFVQDAPAFYVYTSHVSATDIYAGLLGPLVIYPPEMEFGVGNDEVFAFFVIIDENQSPYLAQNIQRFAPGAVVDEEFAESNLKHSVNGLLFGEQQFIGNAFPYNTTMFIAALGNELDLHTAHLHGSVMHPLTQSHKTRNSLDVVPLIPGSRFVATVVPEEQLVGQDWLFHCHVNDHIEAGMLATFRLASEASPLHVLNMGGILLFFFVFI